MRRFSMYLMTCVLMLILVIVAFDKSEAKVHKWKTQLTYPASSQAISYYKQWVDDLREATGGRIDITIYNYGELLPVMETWEGLSRGVTDIHLCTTTYFTGKTPMTIFSTGVNFVLPEVRDWQVAHQTLGVGDLIRKAYAKHNIHYVRSLPDVGLTWLTKFPITKVESVKGKKIRTFGIDAELLAKVGASTVFLPLGEVYGALEKGVVDGLFGNITTDYVTGLHEVAKYIVMPPVAIYGDDVNVNLDSWNKLSGDLKMILTLSTADLGQKLSQFYQYDNAKSLSLMKQKGVKVTSLPDKERKKMASYVLEILDEYGKKYPLFAEALAKVKSYATMRGIIE